MNKNIYDLLDALEGISNMAFKLYSQFVDRGFTKEQALKLTCSFVQGFVGGAVNAE